MKKLTNDISEDYNSDLNLDDLRDSLDGPGMGFEEEKDGSCSNNLAKKRTMLPSMAMANKNTSNVYIKGGNNGGNGGGSTFRDGKIVLMPLTRI